jgi:hypothetical protein
LPHTKIYNCSEAYDADNVVVVVAAAVDDETVTEKQYSCKNFCTFLSI